MSGDVRVEKCNHTLHLKRTDANQRTFGGTWELENGSKTKVICRVCGKFYGRLSTFTEVREQDGTVV